MALFQALSRPSLGRGAPSICWDSFARSDLSSTLCSASRHLWTEFPTWARCPRGRARVVPARVSPRRDPGSSWWVHVASFEERESAINRPGSATEGRPGWKRPRRFGCPDIRRGGWRRGSSCRFHIFCGSGRHAATTFFSAPSGETATWLVHARRRMLEAGHVAEFRDQSGKQAYELGVPNFRFQLTNGTTPEAPWSDLMVDESAGDWPWFVLVTSRHRMYASAYEMEAEWMGYQPLHVPHMFGVMDPENAEKKGLKKWQRMNGLRLVMEPLAAAGSPLDLVKKVEALELDKHLPNFYLSHERLDWSPQRMERTELRTLVAIAMGNIQWSFSNEECGSKRPPFMVVEHAGGYLFGRVVFTPAVPKPSYAKAPHKWSAGIPWELAGVAVNLVASPGDTLVDPCCGSGTIVFEAQRRGVHSAGLDIQHGILLNASKNFQHFGVTHTVGWGPTSPIRGTHNSRTSADLQPDQDTDASLENITHTTLATSQSEHGIVTASKGPMTAAATTSTEASYESDLRSPHSTSSMANSDASIQDRQKDAVFMSSSEELQREVSIFDTTLFISDEDKMTMAYVASPLGCGHLESVLDSAAMESVASRQPSSGTLLHPLSVVGYNQEEGGRQMGVEEPVALCEETASASLATNGLLRSQTRILDPCISVPVCFKHGWGLTVDSAGERVVPASWQPASVAVSFGFADARSVQFEKADCMVGNLPFGRFLKMECGDLDAILRNLRGQAKRFVFFGGTSLRPLLEEAGYMTLKEIVVCPRGKRYMAVAIDRSRVQ